MNLEYAVYPAKLGCSRLKSSLQTIFATRSTELHFSAILVADLHNPIWRTDAGRKTGNASILRRERIT
jgi:hypothetical protein